MSKHTPGPWIAEQDYEGHWNVVCNGEGFEREIVGCEGLYRCDGSDEANARLIAAAPETAAERDELKEANRELLESLKLADGLLAHFKYDIDGSVRSEINAAIAKHSKGE